MKKEFKTGNFIIHKNHLVKSVMSARIPISPPIIAAISADKERPLFSVMVPVYNCINYIEIALKSVLNQDMGPDLMQIEVVDDCSTDGDVAALVEAIGGGRVSYYRQPKNVGSLRNFETCLNRSSGTLVHLLHGDDFVDPGFYAEIKMLFDKFPEIGAAFTEYRYVDESGTTLWNRDLIAPQPQVLNNWLYQIAQNSMTQVVAMVVKRSVYEHLGGFFGVHYGEDWEMWTRIAASYPVAYSPELMANYRVHTKNITGESLLSGQAIKDIYKVIAVIQNYLPLSERKRIKRNSKKNYSEYYAQIAHKLYHDYQNPSAGLKMATDALKMYPSKKTVSSAIKIYLKYMIGYKNEK